MYSIHIANPGPEVFKQRPDWTQVHFFQSPAFIQLLNKSGIYRHGMVVVTDERDEWVAALTYVLLREHGRLFSKLTTRAVIYGGPVLYPRLNEAEARKAVAMALQTLNETLRNRCLYIQFRNFADTSPFEQEFVSNGYRFSERLNLLTNIADLESTYHGLSASRRRQLRLSEKNGLEVRPARSVEEVDQLYGLLSDLYRHKVRKPLPGRALFRQFYRLSLSENTGVVLVATFRGAMVGGIVAPYMPGGRIFEWYVCGLDQSLSGDKVYPSVALTWAAMKHGNAVGCHTFDFMGMGLPSKPYGVREFKARFGGEWVNHGRWLHVNHPLSYRLVELGYNLMRGLKRV